MKSVPGVFNCVQRLLHLLSKYTGRIWGAGRGSSSNSRAVEAGRSVTAAAGAGANSVAGAALPHPPADAPHLIVPWVIVSNLELRDLVAAGAAAGMAVRT